MDQSQRPLQAHGTEGGADDNELYERGILVANPSLRVAYSPHGSCCAFGCRMENPGASHKQGTKSERDKLLHLEGPHALREAHLGTRHHQCPPGWQCSLQSARCRQHLRSGSAVPRGLPGKQDGVEEGGGDGGGHNKILELRTPPS